MACGGLPGPGRLFLRDAERPARRSFAFFPPQNDFSNGRDDMKIAIYGSGGAGKEVYDLLQETPGEREKWEEILFIDDTVPSGEYWGCRRFTFEDFLKKFTPEEARIVIAVGEPKAREDLYNRVKDAGWSLTPPILHRLAFVSDSAVLGEGVVLQDGVRVSPETELGANTFVNHRSMIGHNCVIGKHCQISANVMIAGCVTIGDTVFAGVSSCIRDHTAVGEHTILSMGSVVLKDVRPYKIVLGNPAREIAENKDERVF
jgi:sugar O-acyltransferase (sialic acid O-acetyltransferase NeuD family)